VAPVEPVAPVPPNCVAVPGTPWAPVAPAGPDATIFQSEKVPEPDVPNTLTTSVNPIQLTILAYITFAVLFAFIISMLPTAKAVCDIPN
jgi:hypothetical protein